MSELFVNQINPFHKQIVRDFVNNSGEENFEEVHLNSVKQKLERMYQIQDKFKILSVEYQNQAKSFQLKHNEIAKSEKEKRLQTMNNFDKHYTDIKSQMADENKSLTDENGELSLAIENRRLDEKYQDLVKEVKDKTEVMKQNIEEKDKGSDEIETKMAEQVK